MPVIGKTLTSNFKAPVVTEVGSGHIPVLYRQVMDLLAIVPGGVYLDCTVGAGGHAAGILDACSPNGLLVGLDRDPEAVAVASRRLAGYGERVILKRASYDQLTSVAHQAGIQSFDGILFDLGFSSLQISNPARGFAFDHDAPLDMRYDPEDITTAAFLVNELPEGELADLLYRYGEETSSRQIARAIVAARPIKSTGELALVVGRTKKQQRGRRTVHPATLTFQALRIAVNQELEILSDALPQAVQLLKPGGRLEVISFHSLEDRIVKRFFKQESIDCQCPPDLPVCKCNHKATLKILTNKPVKPDDEEVAGNPKSRSACLRVASKY